MRFHVLTLFPELIEGSFATSITGRALEKGQISLHAVNIRDYANNKHQKVDDYPYGGGAGMVMQAEPVYQAYIDLEKELPRQPRVIYVTPQGRVFDQELAQEFSREEELVFLCGHYEGIDERVLEEIVTDYVSIGDYVLTGGELPALVMMDAISRLVPGVLNNDVSAEFESFHGSLLEYPQYSRPEVWHGKQVPEALMSGNHKKISAWRLEQSRLRTKERRPDLYKEYERRLACEKQLLTNKLLNMDMLESLRADRGKLCFFEENSVILQDAAEGIWQMTAEDPEAGAIVLKKLECLYPAGSEKAKKNLKKMILHQKDYVEAVKETFSFTKVTAYQQWVYTLKNPLPLRYEAQIRLLEDWKTQGAFVENQLVGTLRRNEAGILQDFQMREEWRFRGIERALETVWVNRFVQQGMVPILWLDEADTDYQDLQKSLGLYKAKSPVWLLERE